MKKSNYYVILGIFTYVTMNIVQAPKIDATSCHGDFKDDDFEVNCTSEVGQGVVRRVVITCRNYQSSSTRLKEILHDYVNIPHKKFVDCNFPQELTLFSVTDSLLSSNPFQASLAFEGPLTILSRKNLQDIPVLDLTLERVNFSKLPKDLIHKTKLYTLSIDNATGHIPQDFFLDASLENLRVINNRWRSLKKSVFKGLFNFHMDISGNEISELELGTFDGISNLFDLKIVKNRLQTLPEGIFRSLDHVKMIDLSGNNFSKLPHKLMQSLNRSLITVKLNDNKGGLASLPDGFFKNLPQLKNVELSGNNFTSVPEDLLVGSDSLGELDISRNCLKKIPRKLLGSKTLLKKLTLSRNILEHPLDDIHELKNLKELHINSANLPSLPEKFIAALPNLEILHVSRNELSTIPRDFCNLVENVKDIDFSYNQFTNEIQSVLAKCKSLTDIHLNHNNITQLSPLWNNTTGPMRLYLYNNKISEAEEALIKILKHDMTINLQSNIIEKINITKLYHSTPQTIPNLFSHLHLMDNPFNCDCDLVSLIEYDKGFLHDSVHSHLLVQLDLLKCATPAELYGRSVTSLSREDLKCLVKTNKSSEACNTTCTCWDYTGINTLLVDCSHRNLTDESTTEVLRRILNPKNLSVHLNLSSNFLQKIPEGLNVSLLDVSNNNISNVPRSIFSDYLGELRLHDNSISRLDSDTVEYLESRCSPRNLVHKLNVSLYNNKWICDCEAHGFLELYKSSLKSYQSNNEVKCENRNVTLDALKVDELCINYWEVAVYLLTLLAIFMLSLAILIVVYYRYQEQIKIWGFTRLSCLSCFAEDDLDKDKLYDVFLCYSQLDDEFVEEELKSELESGEDSYRLCLPQRDWLVGGWIPHLIETSVEQSRMTVIVLSPNFARSPWCELEFRTAHEKTLKEGIIRLIVILYGNIDVNQLDPELQRYLKMNTYIKWKDPWFWNKLRYALSRPRRYGRRRRRAREADVIEDNLDPIPVQGVNLRLNTIMLHEISNTAVVYSST